MVDSDGWRKWAENEKEQYDNSDEHRRLSRDRQEWEKNRLEKKV